MNNEDHESFGVIGWVTLVAIIDIVAFALIAFIINVIR